MGFFSWQTADTGQSIWNVHSNEDVRPVFMLQPDGEASIREDAYNGYGNFGGTDAYIWLARQNLPAQLLNGMADEAIRLLGVTLDCGSYYVDARNASKHCVFSAGPSILDPEITFHRCTYDRPLPGYGLSANDLVAAGRWIRQGFTVTRPLKFSFFPGAVYEHLPASSSCPHQGFFDPVEDAA